MSRGGVRDSGEAREGWIQAAKDSGNLQFQFVTHCDNVEEGQKGRNAFVLNVFTLLRVNGVTFLHFHPSAGRLPAWTRDILALTA